MINVKATLCIFVPVVGRNIAPIALAKVGIQNTRERNVHLAKLLKLNKKKATFLRQHQFLLFLVRVLDFLFLLYVVSPLLISKLLRLQKKEKKMLLRIEFPKKRKWARQRNERITSNTSFGTVSNKRNGNLSFR